MKLSVVSKSVSISSLVLTFLAVLIGVWGWIQLEKPYRIYGEYQQYRTTINMDVRVLLEQYLRSSDPTFLQQAEIRLNELEKIEVDWLNEAEKNELKEKILNVEEQIKLVRAAGKLSANPQALLINNERERSMDTDLLFNYVNQSETLHRSDYLEKISDFNQKLIALSHLRQKYIDKNSDELKNNLLSKNKEMLAVIEELRLLPRLGLFSEVDEDALVPEEPEELDLSVMDSLSSLTKRYSKELANSEAMLKSVDDSRQSLNESLVILSAKTDEYGGKVESIKESITSKIKYLMIGIIALLSFMIYMTYYLQEATNSFLVQIQSFLENLVKGNYAQVFDEGYDYDEIMSVKKSGMQLEEYFSTVITELEKQAHEVVMESKNTLSISEQATELTDHQNKSTEMVASSVEELSYSFSEVASNAIKASESAYDANQSTKVASDKLITATENTRKLADDILLMESMMNRLQEDSSKINSVLEVIHGVADQTNLLALNAAIEAARAGEYGRGFAVVADEVRLLAQRTSNSTEEIKKIIAQLVNTTSDANDLVKKHSDSAMECVSYTNEAMDSILPVVASVSSISDMNNNIASATKQQVEVVDGINASVEKIRRDSELVGINVNSVQEAGNMLSLVSESLEKVVKKLKAS
ncbi:MAG: methyl-accepting chemotaxis protein [Gammaproteobacteria bacterium]